MLWTIFVILLILWLLGFSFHIAGGLIHLLLVDCRRGPGHQSDQWPQNSLTFTADIDRHQLIHKPTCNEKGSVR